MEVHWTSQNTVSFAIVKAHANMHSHGRQSMLCRVGDYQSALVVQLLVVLCIEACACCLHWLYHALLCNRSTVYPFTLFGRLLFIT